MRHADNLTARPDDLIFDNVSLNFGGKSVLHGLSFRVPAGGCVALMGASGSGKTSVLKLAAQLLTPTVGRVSGGGRISMQFQEPRLLPWRNAAENVNLVLSDTANLAGITDMADLGGSARRRRSVSGRAVRRHGAARCAMPGVGSTGGHGSAGRTVPGIGSGHPPPCNDCRPAGNLRGGQNASAGHARRGGSGIFYRPHHSLTVTAASR